MRIEERLSQNRRKFVTIYRGEVMRIEKILSQNRRDFVAIYKCEHCGHEYKDNGYDDDNFHRKGIPTFKCPKCGKVADENYKPRSTKYKAWQQV